MTEFVVQRPEFIPETGEALFRYQLGDLRFTETLEFGVGFETTHAKTPTFAGLLDLAAAIIGVSYYKLLAPKTIDTTALKLTEKGIELLRDVYENGLGEFYARNNIKRFGEITYITRAVAADAAECTSPAQPKALVLIGGGKDSLLSVNLLTDAGVAFTPFAVNPKGPILSSIERMTEKPVYVRRYLDQDMLALNDQPGYFNGHVPSTAINSVIASLSALLYGQNQIVLSNERSASEGNLEFDGREVNHQHSKSLAFENLFAETLQSIVSKALQYFSLLRPLSELDIARRFALSTKFDGAFSSCNKNFKQDATGPAYWCGDCPKCHFVSLIFAPFMSPERLTQIVGSNVLDDAAKLAPMRELSGLAGHKPWECVGEILEAAAALWQLSKHPKWQNAAIVKTLKPELEAFYGAQKLETAWADLMQPSAEHAIPLSLYQKLPYEVQNAN